MGLPREMVEAPELGGGGWGGVERGRVLLINPFYAKDQHASFGKHVLAPTLALTALAAVTPAEWEVEIWDENLLQGAASARRRRRWGRHVEEVRSPLCGLPVSSVDGDQGLPALAIGVACSAGEGMGSAYDLRSGSSGRGGIAGSLKAGLRTGSLKAGLQTRVPEVVGITVHLTFARRAYALADWYRRRGVVVVMGGLHVLSCAEEVAAHADILVVGEGTQVWPEVLKDVRAGAWRKRYEGSFRRPYREAAVPRRELLSRDSYLTTTSLIATRGCHNRCGFCYLATDGLSMPYQVRDPDQVAAEFAADGQPYGVFTDNNLGSRPEYLRRLCAALRPIEKIWSAAVTIDVTDDPGLVREMALAGCTGVFVGFETLTDQNLTDARKRTPRSSDYLRRVKIFHENGIQVNGSFVLGFDHDKKDCFARTVDWIVEAKLECATFHILTPYPGTPLFEQMEKEGRLLHRQWEMYDMGHAVFQPKHMSAYELAEGYAWCYKTLFSHGCIWRRRPEDWRAVAGYMAMSYLYKRSNWLWPFLIRHKLVRKAWHPLVELSRRRQVKFRKRLERREVGMESVVVSAGV